MTLSQSLFVIGLLIAASAFFSMAEISLAAARRLRLRQMADEGDARADRVLRMQEQPGDYFTVCLLYTSPSPRDVEESRMPSSA